MADCVIAIGSNLNDRLGYLSQAKLFLTTLSTQPVRCSHLYESEPIGGISHLPYLNAAIRIETTLEATELLASLKNFEQKAGRDPKAIRWANRIIDLDIIGYGNQIVRQENLQIPHPEYQNRLFVLLPMRDIIPEWIDPLTGKTLDEIISDAPKISVFKTSLNW